MAIGVYFALKGMSAEKYNDCVKRLKQAGAGHPTGRSYHSAFGPSNNLMVFDVWASQASFEKFGITLMPILAHLGVEPGKPEIMTIHNVIKPPARAKNAAPARGKARRRVAKKR
jgi:hypothetical protein